MSVATTALVRRALACAVFDLDDPPDPGLHIGPVALRPHQRAAVARLRRALATHRGALLADAVGLGKTWIALALLREVRQPVVIAPAALRSMWRGAAARAGVPVRVLTTESLSTPHPRRLPDADLLVVDEAHHLRTPGTHRRAQAVALCATAPVLLLTATPIHNAARDLTALLALFLGDAMAAALDPATLSYLVVRRRRRDLAPPAAGEDAPPLPRVARTRWWAASAHPALLEALHAIPPPLPPRDGGRAPALDTVTLVRLLASSDAALRAGLRRRLARATALAHALASGRHLTRRDLAAWVPDTDAVQLGLLLDAPDPQGTVALAHAVEAHAAALGRALAALQALGTADPERSAWLRAVRRRHPNARIVLFTQFADTARDTYRTLSSDGEVALLTAAGGHIASGPIGREALLRRFAPIAYGAPEPRPAERVRTLVTTDVLSEGLDLRDASVVVHLDLPWTPARLAQRVGRAARLGATHPWINVYGQRPAAPVADWLRIARRLRAKAAAARRALGGTAPGRVEQDESRGRIRRADLLARRIGIARRAATGRLLERWLVETDETFDPNRTRRTGPVAVTCGLPGLVAVWHPGGRGPPLLVAALGRHPVTDAPGRVARVLRRLLAPDTAVVAPPPALWRAAEASVRAWAGRRRAAELAGLGPESALAWAAHDHRRPGVSKPGGDRPAMPPSCLGCHPPCAPAGDHGSLGPPARMSVHPPCTLARASAMLRAAPPHARASLAATFDEGPNAPEVYHSPSRTAGPGPETAGPRLLALVLLLP